MGNPKQKWTAEEEEALRAGVLKSGSLVLLAMFEDDGGDVELQASDSTWDGGGDRPSILGNFRTNFRRHLPKFRLCKADSPYNSDKFQGKSRGTYVSVYLAGAKIVRTKPIAGRGTSDSGEIKQAVLVKMMINSGKEFP